MRNAIAGAWVYMIVITFMMIFIAYVAIQINYSNAYKLKTDIVTIIEEYDGFNYPAVKAVNRKMIAAGYKTRGRCNELLGNKVFGIKGTTVKNYADHPDMYQWCIGREKQNGDGENSQDRYYYTLEVFFNFNLPILGDMYQFRVNGATDAIYYPSDGYFN